MKDYNFGSLLFSIFQALAFFTIFLLSITPGVGKPAEAYIINSSAKDHISLYYHNIFLESKSFLVAPGDTLKILFDENLFKPVKVNFTETGVKKPVFAVLPTDVVYIQYDKATNTYKFAGNNPAELNFYKRVWHSTLGLDGPKFEMLPGNMPATIEGFMSEWQKIKQESERLIEELSTTDGIRLEMETYLTRELRLRVFSILALPATYHKKEGAVRVFPQFYCDSMARHAQLLRILQAVSVNPSINLIPALRGYINFKSIAEGRLPTFQVQYELAKKEYSGMQREWACYTILNHAKSLRMNIDPLIKDYRSWMSPESKFLRKLNGEENPVELGRELTNSDVLSGLDRKNMSLSDLLTKHKGKLIYIDFWASWCAPCIEQFPAAEKIQKQHKELVMIYLSIDDNAEKWQQASVKYLKDKPEQYRFENRETSSFIKHFNIQGIPHYMIIDSSGKVHLADAPRPSDPFLKEIISGLVKSN